MSNYKKGETVVVTDIDGSTILMKVFKVKDNICTVIPADARKDQFYIGLNVNIKRIRYPEIEELI